MRVAYRESIGKAHDLELTLDKQVGGSSMYAKLVIRIESTLEEYDMSEIQKQRLKSGTHIYSDPEFQKRQRERQIELGKLGLLPSQTAEFKAKRNATATH